MSLSELIREPAEAFDGKLGVSVKHLGTGEAASLNGGELFPTASVFKVPVIVELYRQVDAGAISLDEKVPPTSTRFAMVRAKRSGSTWVIPGFPQRRVV